MTRNTQRAVLDWMLAQAGDGMPVTIEKIARHFPSLTRSQLFSALANLAQKGLLRRAGAGVYRTVVVPVAVIAPPYAGTGTVAVAYSGAAHPSAPVDVNVVGQLGNGTGIVIRESDGSLRVARFER